MNKNYRKPPKSSTIIDILINNRYVVNLIYDQYIVQGSYKSVSEYVQSDERCTSIVRRDIWNDYSDTDDDELIDHLIGNNNNNPHDQYNRIITTNIIQKILTMDKDLIINDRNKLRFNKWLLVQRLISNGYNKMPLYTTISTKSRSDNHLSSVLICGKCHQSMVCHSNRIYQDHRLKYYRCKTRVTSYQRKHSPQFDIEPAIDNDNIEPKIPNDSIEPQIPNDNNEQAIDNDDIEPAIDNDDDDPKIPNDDNNDPKNPINDNNEQAIDNDDNNDPKNVDNDDDPKMVDNDDPKIVDNNDYQKKNDNDDDQKKNDNDKKDDNDQKDPTKDKGLLIGCDCKNLVLDYINWIIFEILINIDISMIENNPKIDHRFMIKLYHHYQSLFISKPYVDISNRIKRSFILIFIHHIIWDDTNNQLTVYFHDTVQRIIVNIQTTTDNNGRINGYEMIKSEYDDQDDDDNNERSSTDDNQNDNKRSSSSFQINHHLIQ